MNPELRDIHLPPPPDWWPPAPGWWLLAVLVLIAVIAAGLTIRRAISRYRRRRQILAALDNLHRDRDLQNRPSEFAAEVSVLLRRVLLSRSETRHAVALSGEDWVRFLGRSGIDSDALIALADAPYRRDTDLDTEQLYRQARRWLQANG